MAINFRIGDRAFYPAQGVTEVIGIESREVSGNQETFYMLRLLNSDRRIMVPLSKAPQVGLRSVIKREDVPKVFNCLRSRPARLCKDNWNKRYRGYIEKLKSGSVYDVAEVLRDLYLLRYEKQLSFGERRLMDHAKELLVQEISVATNENETEIAREIDNLFTPTNEKTTS